MKEFNYKFNKSKINDINDEPHLREKALILMRLIIQNSKIFQEHH